MGAASLIAAARASAAIMRPAWVHLALRGPSVAARCVRSVRSYPLQAVSICAYICVLIGTKTSVVFFPPLCVYTQRGQRSWPLSLRALSLSLLFCL